MTDDLKKTNEALIRQMNNLSLEIEQMQTEQMSEAYTDFDWANRIDRDYLWSRTSGATLPQFRYITKENIDMYADISNFMQVFNPLIQRIIDVKTAFTFSRGYIISSESLQDTIDACKDDTLNKLSMFSHQAITAIDASIQTCGNVFFAVWKNKNPMQIRPWSSYEISDIITDPDDASRPLFYIRNWQDNDNKSHSRAYPSIYILPEDMPNSKMGYIYQGRTYEIDWDVVVVHMSTKKPIKAKFALSELVSTCRWAKPHEKFLEDFAAIASAVRKYTHMMITKGGASQVSALNTQFKGNQDYMGTNLQSNPAGSMVIAQEGTELKVIDAGSNKIVGPKDSRYFLNMVCAASGVPETLLTGDPSTGNLATAKELTGPFLTLIEERQTAWQDILTIIFRLVLDSDDFEVSFPPLRSQDALEYIQSMLAGATLGSPGNWAGTMSPRDFIAALYEALDIQIDEEEKEGLANALGAMAGMSGDEEGNEELEQIAQAAKALAEAVKANEISGN